MSIHILHHFLRLKKCCNLTFPADENVGFPPQTLCRCYEVTLDNGPCPHDKVMVCPPIQGSFKKKTIFLFYFKLEAPCTGFLSLACRDWAAISSLTSLGVPTAEANH